MRFFDAAAIDNALTFPALLNAMDAALRAQIVVPLRHHHPILRPDGDAMHLLMPAWSAASGGSLGVKIVNVFPGNAARGLPSVAGLYVLMDGDTGVPVAALDGARLTLWRTAACSALAARYLARPESATHVMIGAGALAPFYIRAYAQTFAIKKHLLWNRSVQNARTLADQLAQEGLAVEVVEDLDAAVAQADIVSAATMSRAALVRGAALRPGTHVDLVGAYTPAMRESDDTAVLRARLFADTREGATKEGGDFAQPIAAGVIAPSRIEADLLDLARGNFHFTRAPGDITLYKATGGALFDLATADFIVARA